MDGLIRDQTATEYENSHSRAGVNSIFKVNSLIFTKNSITMINQLTLTKFFIYL